MRKFFAYAKMDIMNTAEKNLDHNGLKFSREQGFFDKSLAVKLLIGIIFVLSIFLILHFRDVRVEMFEFNSVAPKYLVAQTDFSFYDEEGTIIRKQEAVENIGKIYRICDTQVHSRRTHLEHSLVKDENWRKELEKVSLDTMYQAIAELEKTMLSLRFTDPRTLQKLKKVDIPTSSYILFTPPKPQQQVLFPLPIWSKIRQIAFPNGQFATKQIDFLIKQWEREPFELVEDIPAETALRKALKSRVKDKFTKVTAGSRIIDQGETVTSRHVAMLQAMKHALNEQRNVWSVPTLIGSAILSLIIGGISAAYIYVNYPEIMAANRKLFLIVTVAILTLGIAKLTEFFFLTSKGNLIEIIRYPLFVPFSAILLCSLLNPAIATFTSALLSILLMMTLAFDRQGFLILNLTAALIAILSARTLRQRKEIFIVCAKAWLVCIAVILSLNLYQNTIGQGIIIDILSSGAFMLLTAVVVVGLYPLLESGFRMMTDVTLMEYMDPNHDLLRRLSIEAAGTYQHSVVVGNLAEAAALAIGANGLFCRVATLYHDVGKMATPQYFTENQHGGMNIHQLLTPQESAQVIIAHVPEGVALARKAGLPEPFIDIIKEHHGTTLVYYFYRKELEKKGEDRTLVNESLFRYCGPTPRSKESLIIMLADSLEAASRSLEQVTKETLTDLTNRIAKEKAEDGQFDHSLLTLEELAIVKATLVKTLAAYGHARVKYPKRQLGEETLKDDI